MAQDNMTKRVTFGVLGGLIALVGVALLVLPGPGLILVLAGLVLLARAVPALERYVGPVRVAAVRAAQESVASPLRIAGSALAGLLLIGAGVVWALVPAIPFGGWSSGAGLILAGLILWGLLLWTYRRHGGRAPSGASDRGE